MRRLLKPAAVAVTLVPLLAAAQAPRAPDRGTYDYSGVQSTVTDAAGVRTTRSFTVLKDLRPFDPVVGTSVRIGEEYAGPAGSGQRFATCTIDPTQYRAGAGSAALSPTTITFSACTENTGARYGENAGPWTFEGSTVVAANWNLPLDTSRGSSQDQRTIRGPAPGGFRANCQYFYGQYAQGSARIGDYSWTLSWDAGTEAASQYSFYEYRNCTFADL